jgi:hypothetical protein
MISSESTEESNPKRLVNQNVLVSQMIKVDQALEITLRVRVNQD